MRVKRGQLGIVLIFVLVFAYTYYDIATGATGYNFSGESRAASHYLLAATIGAILLYVISQKKSQLNGNGQYTNVLLILCAWITLNCVFHQISLWTTITYAGFVIWWILSFQMAKRYCSLEANNDRLLLILSVVMLLFYVYEFIATFRYANSLGNSNYAVLNIVFRVLVFLPIVFLIENKILKRILIIAIVIIVCASLKRAALLACPLMILSYSFIDAKVKQNSLKGFFRILGIVLFIIFAFVVANHFFDGFLADRFSREQLVYASGRTERWTESLSVIGSRDIGELLFGTGIGSAGYSQHNELIEQLYSFGVIGFVIYIAFFLKLVQTYIFYRKNNSQYAASYLTLLVYFIVVGSVSGFMFMHSTFYLFIFMGIVDSKEPYLKYRSV